MAIEKGDVEKYGKLLRERKKKGVSSPHHTAQPGTFACFRTWRIKGSWLYGTYSDTKVRIFSEV